MYKYKINKDSLISICIAIASITALYLAHLYDYIIFHTFVELFSFVIGMAIFIFVLNARKYIENNYYLFIGIAYLFIALLDLLHALSYKGINIFGGFDSNLPTQLWIFGRYIESISIIVALLLINKKIRIGLVYISYSLVLIFGLLSIFLFGIFPDCYIEGSGLTTFKIISEYIIIFILVMSSILFHLRRKNFSMPVFRFFMFAIISTILSEFFFSLYTDVYGFFNMLGHMFKVVSYYMIYKAIISSGLMKPYETLFFKLKKSEKRFKNIVNLLPDIVVETNMSGIITFVNETGLSITGYNKDDIERGLSIKSVIAPEYHKSLLENIAKIKKGIDIGTTKYEAVKKNGTKFPVLIKRNIIQDENRKFKGLRVVAVDISELIEKDGIIDDALKKYKDMFENSLDGRYRSSIGGEYLEVNNSLVQMLGYDSKEDLMRQNIATEIYAESSERPNSDMRQKSFEAVLKKKDGSSICVEISSRVVLKEGKPNYYIGSVRDITARKKAEEGFKYLSFHDGLTGLYNRAFFEEEIKRLNTDRQLPLTIAIGDVNGLKVINDTLGHQTGDMLLKKIAAILRISFRDEDIVCRWGGDEFAVLLPNTEKEKALKIIYRIHEQCISKSTESMPLNISFGVSTKKEIQNDIRKVIKKAEDKMYRHKLIDRKSFHSSIILSLEKALEERDYETEEHIKRMRHYAEEIGKKLNLSDGKIAELNLVASLHDIGKLSIPDNIILKKGKLNKKEWELMKKHVDAGYRIISTSLELNTIAEAVKAHHEWYDGNGYPGGLKRDEIPFSSRIISVVDAYDAMTNDRPYRKALSEEEAIAELKSFSGSQFDPKIVNAFLEVIGLELYQK